MHGSSRFLLAMLLLVFMQSAAHAVIKKLTPLKDVINDASAIVLAEVDQVDSERPSVTFKYQDKLKGQVEWKSIAVNLKGDSFARKDGHTQAMLDRLVPGRKLILFLTPVEKTTVGFAFLEGTWFQLRGTTNDQGTNWAFLHCEPYFRRTFRGTTQELNTVVADAISGKAAPPEPVEKEEPGLGPLPEKPEKPERQSAAVRSLALFGVIPSAVLVAPLAVIAALFPGVFARLALTMKQWRAFLAIASINTTIATVYYFVRPWLPDHPLASPKAVLVLMSLNAIIGCIWAGLRHRRMACDHSIASIEPKRNHLLGLLIAIVVLSVVVIAPVWIFSGKEQLIDVPFREFVAVLTGLILAFGYALYRRVTRHVDPSDATIRLGLTGETIALAGIALFGFALLSIQQRNTAGSALSSQIGDAEESAIGPKLGDVQIFTFPGANEVYSGLTLDESGRLYFGAESRGGTGSVWCVDTASGKPIWKFTNDGDLQPVYCIPTVNQGKVYVGEGLHTDSDRRMFCLDATTGQAIWNFTTSSHTEGRAAIADGHLIFCAGDDGLFCIDITDRSKRWHFEGSPQHLHIDTPPAVRGQKVFFGSGYHTLALLCADSKTGAELWRTPVDLRSFGAPIVRGKHVYFGLGTGNLIDDLSSEPEHSSVHKETLARGAIVCLSVESGQEIWRYELPKSVHTEMAADLRTIYACCKDGTVYAVDRASGRLRWKRPLGTAFAAGPAIATHAGGAATVAIYAVSMEGRVACLNPANGELFWERDLAEISGKNVQILSTPVVANHPGGKRTLYVGGKTENRNNGERLATIFRLEDFVDD